MGRLSCCHTFSLEAVAMTDPASGPRVLPGEEALATLGPGVSSRDRHPTPHVVVLSTGLPSGGTSVYSTC